MTTESVNVLVHKYQSARVFVPCNAIAADPFPLIGGTPTNIFNRRLAWYGEIDASPGAIGQAIDFRIKPVSSKGQVIVEDDAVGAYIIIDGARYAPDGAPIIRFGLWRASTGAWVGGTSSYGRLTSTDLALRTLWSQRDVAVAILPNSSLIRSDGFIEPVVNFDWRYSNGGLNTAMSDLYVRVYIEDGTDGSDFIPVTELGIELLVAFADTASGFVPGRQWLGSRFEVLKRGTLKRDPAAVQGQFAQCYLMARDMSLDDDDGTVVDGATANGNISNPANIADHLLRKWGNGVIGADLLTASGQFGSTQDAAADVNKWPQIMGAGLAWRSTIQATSRTTLRDMVNALCSHAPLYFGRDPRGRFYAAAYPETTDDCAQNKFKDSNNDQVVFHPNSLDSRAKDHGKPYAMDPDTFSVETGLLKDIYTRFTVHYRIFTPTGRAAFTQRITEAAADSNVWLPSMNPDDLPTGDPADLPNDITGQDPRQHCANAQSMYGDGTRLHINEMEIDAGTLHWHSDATALLIYCIRRFCGKRMIVGGEAGIEAYDLKVGHIVRFSNDWNLVKRRIDAEMWPAEGISGWGGLEYPGFEPDYWVTSVRLVPKTRGFRVRVKAEMVNYASV